MREINAGEIDRNVFDLIGSDWMLVAAGDERRANAMTASWGGLGVVWGRPAATIYLRPQRYTKEFVDVQSNLLAELLRRRLPRCAQVLRQRVRTR